MLHLVTGGWHQCTPAWGGGGLQPHCKLYAPASGEAWYDAGAGEQRLHAGRLWLIPGGRMHRWRCPQRFDRCDQVVPELRHDGADRAAACLLVESR